MLLLFTPVSYHQLSFVCHPVVVSLDLSSSSISSPLLYSLFFFYSSSLRGAVCVKYWGWGGRPELLYCLYSSIVCCLCNTYCLFLTSPYAAFNTYAYENSSKWKICQWDEIFRAVSNPFSLSPDYFLRWTLASPPLLSYFIYLHSSGGYGTGSVPAVSSVCFVLCHFLCLSLAPYSLTQSHFFYSSALSFSIWVLSIPLSVWGVTVYCPWSDCDWLSAACL